MRRLIEALRKAGAKAIGLDIIFAEPSVDPAADAALAAALGPDVTLAGDETLIKTPQADQSMRIEPLPNSSPRRKGRASPRSCSTATARCAACRAIRTVLPPYLPRPPGGAAGVPGGALLQTFGPARTFPTASYYQALSPDEFLPKDFFRGRVVIVGLCMQSAPAADAGGADALRPRSRCIPANWSPAPKSRRRSTTTSPSVCPSPPARRR